MPVPEPEPGFWRATAGVKAGAKAGLKEAFSAGNIAETVIPETILRVADVAAAREAIRTIQIKFAKEGYAKGVAAGVAGWSYMEAHSNLKYCVTQGRLRGLGRPRRSSRTSRMLQIAEATENYAVDLGHQFSSSQTLEWKEKQLADGLAELAKHGYHFKAPPDAPAVKRVHHGTFIVEEELDPAESGPKSKPQYLSTNYFIDKLAWVLQPTTDRKVEEADREPLTWAITGKVEEKH